MSCPASPHHESDAPLLTRTTCCACHATRLFCAKPRGIALFRSIQNASSIAAAHKLGTHCNSPSCGHKYCNFCPHTGHRHNHWQCWACDSFNCVKKKSCTRCDYERDGACLLWLKRDMVRVARGVRVKEEDRRLKRQGDDSFEGSDLWIAYMMEKGDWGKVEKEQKWRLAVEAEERNVKGGKMGVDEKDEIEDLSRGGLRGKFEKIKYPRMR